MDSDSEILLIQRGSQPFKQFYALPGGFVGPDETLLEAARRELEEETGLAGIELFQVHTFSAPDRDPRGRTITTVFGTIIEPSTELTIKPGSDASSAAWFNLATLPELAFDHRKIIDFCANYFQLSLR
jgi:8-oxo-dGTP diphosphatase